MRLAYSLALVVLSAAPLSGLTGAKVDVDLPGLERKAGQVVRMNLEGQTLEQGSALLAIREGVTSSMKGLLRGLKGIYRRTYRFGRGDSYQDEDVAPIYGRLTDDGWSPTLDVRDSNRKEALAIYSYYEGEQLRGITVVSSDPSEVTVVNIVGEVDLEALAEFGEQLGVPVMHLSTTEIEKLKLQLPDAPRK